MNTEIIVETSLLHKVEITTNAEDNEYGFQINGQTFEGGQLRSVGGILYGPMQTVSSVTKDSLAYKAGLRIGDRIRSVNGIRVESMAQHTVIDLIKQTGVFLKLEVLTLTKEDANYLDGNTDKVLRNVKKFVGSHLYDRKYIIITIPNVTHIYEKNNVNYINYDVYYQGSYLCSRRYSHFFKYYNELKNKFTPDILTNFPKKWPFKLDKHQIDRRRRLLEAWIDNICSIQEIFDNSITQEFFSNFEPKSFKLIYLNVYLPDDNILTVQVDESTTISDKLLEILDIAEYFDVFSIFVYDYDYSITHKSDNVCYLIYNFNYSKFYLKKWVFSLNLEAFMIENSLTLKYLYYTVISDLANFNLDEESLKYIIHLKNKNKYKEVVNKLQKYNHYNTIIFKGVDITYMDLDNYTANLKLSYNIIEIEIDIKNDENVHIENIYWIDIISVKIKHDGSIIVNYKKEDNDVTLTIDCKKIKYVKACFDKIMEESKLNYEV
ncbi:hypothetical protein A3Q56_03844 [Intoshia linei]|uniref:Sorting nexin-27 n=1 Tax=Intoshia linei TaxID=1819745 RepID=A0A177B4U5_9BILA|nr:hypothetical protein A3Q56_03844 [Intoshia linei]